MGDPWIEQAWLTGRELCEHLFEANWELDIEKDKIIFSFEGRNQIWYINLYNNEPHDFSAELYFCDKGDYVMEPIQCFGEQQDLLDHLNEGNIQ